MTQTTPLAPAVDLVFLEQSFVHQKQRALNPRNLTPVSNWELENFILASFILCLYLVCITFTRVGTGARVNEIKSEWVRIVPLFFHSENFVCPLKGKSNSHHSTLKENMNFSVTLVFHYFQTRQIPFLPMRYHFIFYERISITNNRPGRKILFTQVFQAACCLVSERCWKIRGND